MQLQWFLQALLFLFHQRSRGERQIKCPILVLIALTCTGCGQTETTLEPARLEPFKNETLRIACSVEFPPRLIEQYAAEWSALQGVQCHIEKLVDDRSNFKWDVAVINVAELPALVESGRCRPLPSTILGREHFYQWDSVLSNYTGLLSTWNGGAYAIPLFGEGLVLVYRKDRLAAEKLAPPKTWDDFLTAAAKLARPGKPSLPALPNSPLALETEFHSIAACYERQALQQGDEGAKLPDEDSADRIYSYAYRLKTLAPRINTAAFVKALQLMQQLQPFRSGRDEGDAFGDGRASLAVAGLADVARFQAPGSPVRGKFGIAPLPGSRTTYDLDGQKSSEQNTRAETINRVPYIGTGSWIGVVSTDCAHPDMAFEFLASLARPEQMGAEVITAAKWGAGPIRSTQTEGNSRGLWFGYDLTSNETDELLAALKQHLAPGVINRRYRLRLPNQQQHVEAFDQIVRPALTAPASDAQRTLDAVADAWQKLWADIPREKKRAWIYHSHGL